ncbi:RHS repeat domain-containing protein [Litoribacter populi]|uniref:RHS repeat domain-containing protein n=1 Tax=Litoribacter populi TaxID=2598460 RepID=UPI00163DDE68|nr:RHS repeat-associated core domain-containing protein [Litoribacter populi]
MASSHQGYRTLGGKRYELSNHLGNVLAVVTDNIRMDSDSTWAQVRALTDYYPFGLAMEGRGYQDTTVYRYGFNGKENDSETGTQDYGFRIYDPKIAKFLSVDPLTSTFPWWTNEEFNLTAKDGKRRKEDWNLFAFLLPLRFPPIFRIAWRLGVL